MVSVLLSNNTLPPYTHNHGRVPWIIIVYSQGTRDDDKHNHLL